MTQHPTKEQVEAARRVVFGEIAGRGEILQVRQVLLGLPDPLAGEMSTQELAGRILAAALASAERDAERFRSHIRRITERHCDCGGAPAGDSGCVACRIYHELNAAVGKEAE